MGRNDPCFCGSGKKWKKCHYPFQPQNGSLKERYLKQFQILIKNSEEIAGIKAACQLAAQILQKLLAAAQEGVTTLEIDRLAAELHREAGAIAAPLGYGSPPYPFSTCTSVNDVICHGFPDKTPLKDGDIVNIDVSPLLGGYYGDCSAMAVIGKPSEEALRVVEVAKSSLERACKVCKPGALLSEIGHAIESYARSRGCTVVHQFVGHGVGVRFHEPPQILHYENDMAIPLAPGMTFTIEPMINAGSPEAKIDETRWIARTVDGKPSAQWEHTVLITEQGSEILTLLDR